MSHLRAVPCPRGVRLADYCVFHLGSGPKFVKHAFERCQANAFGFNSMKGGRTKKYDGKLSVDETTLLFNKKVAPSLRLATYAVLPCVLVICGVELPSS